MNISTNIMDGGLNTLVHSFVLRESWMNRAFYSIDEFLSY
jgi:hypothetical protein